MSSSLRVGRLEQVNRELWLVLSLFVIAGVLNLLLAGQRMVLGLYALPTVGSAYLYGRRHATLTAFSSVLLVVLLMYANPAVSAPPYRAELFGGMWMEIMVWGGTLVITGYLMGTLYEQRTRQLNELRETYIGVLTILRHFISSDEYTENHSYRVSAYAVRIAARVGLNADRIEDIRAAALLHDIGKLEISRSLLYKAARLTQEEFEEMQQHVAKGVSLLEPVGGSLRRVLPIVLAHHDKFNGKGYHPRGGEQIPLEARILAVADVYDSLTSDRPYRKAMSPYEAKEVLIKGSGVDFDPDVVEAFVAAFRRGELDKLPVYA